MAIGSMGHSYGNGYFISASGLMDASLRLDVSADNVANANTNGFIPDRVDSLAQAGGGVRGLVVLGNAGMISDKSQPSQTDYATEAVNMTLARRAYEANARMITDRHEADKSLMDMIG
jgi:flagellar basal body rod protein FlgG